jgi:predicted dehydrogenase
LNFAIVGCGLAGTKRLRALSPEHRLVVAADPLRDRAETLAAFSGDAVAETDWQPAVQRPDVDAVIVATPHRWLAEITLAAVRSRKHVFVEKPAARTHKELRPLITEMDRYGVTVQVGYNHRYHPAIQRAHQLAASGSIGSLMYVRGRYGHGGRLNYDKEWRLDPNISGGGQLLDQGVHLIDLARWFLGDFPHVTGITRRYYWDTPAEDNAFLALQTAQDQMAWLHMSCTEWKNLLSLEIYGECGKLHIDGLGGSYGVERLTHHRVLPAMGPPETLSWEYAGDDVSWRREMEAFVQAIETEEVPAVTVLDAYEVLKVVDRVYEENVYLSRPPSPDESGRS